MKIKLHSNLWQKALLLIVMMLLVPVSSFAQDNSFQSNSQNIKSPLKQFFDGTKAELIVCEKAFVLVVKTSNDHPACVKPSSAEILVQRGWALIISKSIDEESSKFSQTNKNVSVQSISDANNKFMFDFYSQISDTTEDNIFFSPWSMMNAFSVLYEGAKGSTAEEIGSVFYLPKDNSVRRSSFESIHSELASDSGYELRNANALWIKNGFGIKDDFITIAKQFYDVKVAETSFPAGEDMIDSWIQEKTNNKITELVKDQTNDLTKFVITNAVYFKGAWFTKFDPDHTREGDFKINPHKIIKTPMMHLESDFAYAETREFEILAMPYKEKISMIILLPKDNNLNSLNSITLQELKDLKKDMTYERLSVTIPKFKFETEYDLTKSMKDLGMILAFDEDNADLTGIADKRLFVKSAIHKAYIDVNEEGAEAAAATAIIDDLVTAQQLPIFIADHPFVFLIQDDESGLILFMGKVVDPTK